MPWTEENIPSGVAQSVLTSTRLRCCSMIARERFTPDIPRILWNWNSFVKRSGAKFLLTIVRVWSATTENVWLRLLLPKEGQSVIKSKSSHTFSTLHCECLQGVINKDMKNYNCLCVISLSRPCLSIVATYEMLWPIYADIQVILKGSHTFSSHCIFSYYIPLLRFVCIG